MRVKKRPVEVEAVQWFDGVEVDGVVRGGFGHACAMAEPHVHTLEGPLRVSPGDWIITGVVGEKYPCKSDVFEKTYDLPVEKVDHPKHYNAHPSGVEAVVLCEHLGFNVGNAVKYLFRADYKESAAEDLRKASWYLKWELERTMDVGNWFLSASARRHAEYVAEHDRGVLGDVLRALFAAHGSRAGNVRAARERVETEISKREGA